MDSHYSVVIVEDHDDLRHALCEVVEAAGHEVYGFSCSEDLDDQLGLPPIDVLVVDLGLPGENGLSLAQRFRVSCPATGIVMMTAKADLDSRLEGYKSGADIYLPKPAHPEELLAAITAVAKRRETIERVMASHQNQSVQLDRKTLTLHGPCGEAALSEREAVLLEALTRAAGKRLEFWQLSSLCATDAELPSNATLKVIMTRLRAKLSTVAGNAAVIRALRGFGYQLCIRIESI